MESKPGHSIDSITTPADRSAVILSAVNKWTLEQQNSLSNETSEDQIISELQVARRIEADPRVAELAERENNQSILRLPHIGLQFGNPTYHIHGRFEPKVGYISPEHYVGAMLIIANARQETIDCLYRFRHGQFAGDSVFTVWPGARLEEISFRSTHEPRIATAPRSPVESKIEEIETFDNNSSRINVVRGVGRAIRIIRASIGRAFRSDGGPWGLRSDGAVPQNLTDRPDLAGVRRARYLESLKHGVTSLLPGRVGNNERAED